MTTSEKRVSAGAYRDKIAALGPWFHNVRLPDGSLTAPDHFLGDFPTFKWREIEPHLPRDLSGASVLEIGCNAGFYSFALAERGANVLGIDTDPHYLRQARWLQEVFGQPNVRFENWSVYDVDRIRQQFDIVFFMGVIYHLRHPLLALDILAKLEPELLVFQSLTFGGDVVSSHIQDELNFANRELLAAPDWPHMAFIEHEFCDDPTNWWVPNRAAIEGMLRSAGFCVKARPAQEVYLCAYDGGGINTRDGTDLAFATEAVRRIGS